MSADQTVLCVCVCFQVNVATQCDPDEVIILSDSEWPFTFDLSLDCKIVHTFFQDWPFVLKRRGKKGSSCFGGGKYLESYTFSIQFKYNISQYFWEGLNKKES